MRRIDLGGAWTVADASEGEPLPAQVPGCVHLDLLRAGRLPELAWRDNEDQYHWVAERDWIYERSFAVGADLLDAAHVLLRCDGLDTLAEISVNGRRVLDADNMFRTWEIDVRDALVAGDNRIAVRFRSTVPFLEERQQRKRLPNWNVWDKRYDGRGWIRKMACSFGWDWGPMAPTCGIWRGIAILGFDGRLADVRLSQRHADGGVSVTVDAAVEAPAAPSCRVRARLSLGGAAVAEAVGAPGERLRLDVRDPQLWWPNGLGQQTLYDIEVVLEDADGAAVDAWRRRIGLRTIALLREQDGWGESFAFVVNGVRFFSKGANWIPSDIFVPRLTRDDYRRLLLAARDAHMNMLRCWGGGIYEQDDFYELCDELGLLVWQDFMFACGTYPSFDDAFMASVRAEAVDNIRRLRHHPSMALWCGNNELEQGLVQEQWTHSAMSWADYKPLFDVLLRDVVEEEDGATPYWPSSPHTPHGDRYDFNNPTCGDAHCWDVWFGGKPFEYQRQWMHRFMSEFGFQSFPEPRTVEAFTAPEDRNLTSYIMDFHQRSGDGNTKIFRYLLDWFRVPKDFPNQLWMTQLTQALCIQYACEHARRMQPRMEGVIYWQINDIWPAATWSSIDVFGRWKALHHVARRFFAPLHVSGVEDQASRSVAIHVSNHRLQESSGVLRWRVGDTDGNELAAGEAAAACAPQSAREVVRVDCAGAIARCGARRVLVWMELEEDGAVVSRNLALFARPKHLELRDPAIRHEVLADKDAGAFRIELRAERPALWARLELDGADADFGDNFVHLEAGRPVTVSCRPWQRLGLDELRRRLRVTSVVHT